MANLQIEAKAYEEALPSMVRGHSGQYVVIKGSQLHEYFDSYELALDWAYGRFGVSSFFVKKINPEHGVAHFTRDVGPCRS